MQDWVFRLGTQIKIGEKFTGNGVRLKRISPCQFVLFNQDLLGNYLKIAETKITLNKSFGETLNEHKHVCACEQMGAGKISEMCVRETFLTSDS